MSPEQVTGAVLDGRSDLFAVAIVLAEMLMCKRLFTAQNDLDVLLMVRDGRLERFDKYAKDIPQALETIVRRGWPRTQTNVSRPPPSFAIPCMTWNSNLACAWARPTLVCWPRTCSTRAPRRWSG